MAHKKIGWYNIHSQLSNRTEKDRTIILSAYKALLAAFALFDYALSVPSCRRRRYKR